MFHKAFSTTLKGALTFSSLSLLIITLAFIRGVFKVKYGDSIFNYHTQTKYSLLLDYIGESHPIFYPEVVPTVQEHIHNHVRYPISKNVSHGMWVVAGSLSDGFFRLGDPQRAFYSAMWHELHCLYVIYKNYEADRDVFGGEEHFQHCLNYLRQYILCAADDTLEPGDYQKDDIGYTRQCLDWRNMFDMSDEDNRHFTASH